MRAHKFAAGCRHLIGLALGLSLFGPCLPSQATYFDPVKKLRKRMEDKSRQAVPPEDQVSPPPGQQTPRPAPTSRQGQRTAPSKPNPVTKPQQQGSKPVVAKPRASAPVTVSPRIYVVVQLGTVQIRANNTQNWQPLRTGLWLEAGDQIQTGPVGSMAQLALPDGSNLHLDRATNLILERGSKRTVRLLQGQLWSKILTAPNGGLWVRTPGAVVGTRHGEFIVHVDADQRVIVAAAQGVIDVTRGSGKEVKVAAGQFVVARADGPLSVPKALDDLPHEVPGVSLEFAPRLMIAGAQAPAMLSGTQMLEVLLGLGKWPVSRVELVIDGGTRYVANVPPYRFNLESGSLSNGQHLFKAVVYWADGDLTSTRELPVQVENAVTATPAPTAPTATTSP